MRLRHSGVTEMRRWSIEHIDDFWQAIWDYFRIEASTPPRAVLGKRTMPGAEWFPGSRLNWAQHILRNEKPGKTALLHCSERQPLKELEWSELGNNVRKLATQLRALGIKPGDRVAAYLPNIPEAVTAVENAATARTQHEKAQALWRVAVAFGFVFPLEEFLTVLPGRPFSP